MSETTTENTEAAAETSGDNPEATAPEATKQETPEVRDPAKLLNAYEAEKAKRKERDEEFRTLRSEFDAFKAKAEGKEAEFTAQQEAQRVKDEALAAADERILKAELRAAAKGKLSDPSDAFRYPEQIDLATFEVGEDGSVDGTALEAAVDKLIETKPYLAVQDGKRFQGDPDAGTRKEARPSQLTKSDLERMSHEEINAARKEGRLDDLMGIK